MEFIPLKCDREDAPSLGRCAGSTACHHLSLEQEIAPEWGEQNKTNPKTKKPQGSGANQALPLQTSVNPIPRAPDCLQLLDKHVAQQLHC